MHDRPFVQFEVHDSIGPVRFVDQSSWHYPRGWYSARGFPGHCSWRTEILEFLSTRKTAELAQRLAQDLARRYPPAIANNPAKMVSQQRLSAILEDVYARALELSREDPLGWYKRARLRSSFRWELDELGYDEKFVAMACEGLVLRLSRRPELTS